VRRLTLALDALPTLREASCSDVDLPAAATLAELAGVEAVRIGVTEDLKPVREEDVLELRRGARHLELRMPPSQSLVRVALEARPDRVLLAAPGLDGRSPASPLDVRSRASGCAGVVRAMAEVGIPALLLVAPELEAVKVAHAENACGVEFFTGSLVDLPPLERARELERLGDAVRLAAKLRLEVGLGGGLGYRSVREVLAAAPAVESVAVGRAALSRAVLVGLDLAVREMLALLK